MARQNKTTTTTTTKTTTIATKIWKLFIIWQKKKKHWEKEKRLWNSLALPKLLLFSKATTKIYCKHKHWQNKENKNILCSIYVIKFDIKNSENVMKIEKQHWKMRKSYCNRLLGRNKWIEIKKVFFQRLWMLVSSSRKWHQILKHST